MKKMMAGILTSIAAVCIGMATIPAVAQDAGFTDSDGDGVCDNRATRIAGQAAAGRGAGFTDSDGDGVCDNRATGRGERNARRCMRGGKELCTVTVN